MGKKTTLRNKRQQILKLRREGFRLWRIAELVGWPEWDVACFLAEERGIPWSVLFREEYAARKRLTRPPESIG